MDATQFDDLTRALARGLTRRSFLRALLGGAGAGAGLLGTRSASARGAAKTTLCHATGDPSQPWVVITVADPAWPAHEAHGDRRVTPDLLSDPRNCGACAHECPAPRPGTCEGASICVDGVCGFTPLPLCGGSCCDAGEQCLADTCVACGGDGEFCCAGDTCDAGLVCDGFCRECGGFGERCCAGNTCDADLGCTQGPFWPVCARCGGDGERCCVGNTCDAGLVCDPGLFGEFPTCLA